MAMTEQDKTRWAEIDSVIEQNKGELKAATSHVPLRKFAEKQGWDNRQDFPKYKFSLRKIGVDYGALREVATEERQVELAAKADALTANAGSAPVVMLWTAAVEGDDGSGAFAVVSVEDDAVWYGRFFDDDRVRVPGDLISGEQSAAEKAVFVASKAFAAAGHDVGRLIVTTMCPELDIAALKAAGAEHNIAVDVSVDDEDQRALTMAEAPGFKRWKDNDLAALVEDDDE